MKPPYAQKSVEQSPQQRTLDRQSAVFFRDALRSGRAAALRDAEGFLSLVVAIEQFGAWLTSNHKAHGLGDYKQALLDHANGSPIAKELPMQHPAYHTPASRLFAVLKDGRNDAFHEGAVARNLTTVAVEFAAILEEAIVLNAPSSDVFLTIDAHMIREPVTAALWQPVSYLRRQLLVHSFSYIPIFLDEPAGWHLASDHAVAMYLNSAPSNSQRKTLLAKTIAEAHNANTLTLLVAYTCFPATSVKEALAACDGRPIVIVDPNDQRNLLGIATPFDLL